MHLLQTKMSVYLGSTQLGSIPWIYTDWNWNFFGGQSILTQKCIQLTIFHNVNFVTWATGSQQDEAKFLWHLRHLPRLYFPETLSRIWVSGPTLTPISTIMPNIPTEIGCTLILACKKMFKSSLNFNKFLSLSPYMLSFGPKWESPKRLSQPKTR